MFQVPHLVYHLRHLDVYDTADKIGNVVSLSAALVLPGILLAVALSTQVHSASSSSSTRRPASTDAPIGSA